jgi:ribosomal subunit interface protein
MQVVIQSQGFVPFEGLREYIQQRLAFGLGRIARRVGDVVVQLTGGHRSRHGSDMRCQIRIRLGPAMEVVVEEAQPDMYAAIEHAAARVLRAVSRSLRRSRHLRLPIRGAGNVAQPPNDGK